MNHSHIDLSSRLIPDELPSRTLTTEPLVLHVDDAAMVTELLLAIPRLVARLRKDAP